MSPPKLLWLDLETTGLDPATQDIIQLGMIVTDHKLNELGRFEELVRCTRPHTDWEDAAWMMHGPHFSSSTGLARKVAQAPFLLGEVGILAKSFLLKTVGDEKAVLAGNSVHFDRSFLQAKECKEILSFVGHRHLDVSTFKVLGEMYGWSRPKGPAAHTALADLQMAIHSLKEVSAQFGLDLSTEIPF